MAIQRTRKCSLFCLMLYVVFYATTSPSPSVAGGELDELAMEKALLAHVRPLLDLLRERKVKVVGVLKFVVKRDGHTLSPSEGTLNMRLAEKTEQALVVATPPSADAIARQVGVVRNATATASTIPDATHLDLKDPTKREKLFLKKYKLAWSIDGKEEAVPDAFVYGVALVRADSVHVDIELNAFVKGEKELIQQEAFATVLDTMDRISLGEGHLVGLSNSPRTTRNGKDTFEDAALESTLKSKEVPNQHVLQRKDAPLGIDIEFDGAKQNLQFHRDVKTGEIECKVSEPRAGQAVVFRIVRKNVSDMTRYGIVLKVNGENTLYREKFPDNQCSLWVLEPNATSLLVPGYQKTKSAGGGTNPFLIVEGAEAIDSAKFYGQEAGLVTLTVYSEREVDQPKESILREDETYRLIQDTVIPKETASNLSQLRGRLSRSILGEIYTRGIMVPDSKTQTHVTIDAVFKREDRPFFSASIRYYKP